MWPQWPPGRTGSRMSSSWRPSDPWRRSAASSLSICRWDTEAGVLRTLVNVGELGPGEERFPENETYSVDDYPSMRQAMREGGSSLGAIDDPDTDPALRDLLRRLGKESSLAVPMILDGEPWGELEVMTAPGQPRLARATRRSFARSRTSWWARSTAPSCSPRSRRSPTRTR